MARMRQAMIALVAGLVLVVGAAPALAGTATASTAGTAVPTAAEGTGSDETGSDGSGTDETATDDTGTDETGTGAADDGTEGTASDDTACRALAAGYTASAPCQLVIELAQGVCRDDSPVLQYTVVPEGTPNTTVTITWINPDGDDVVQAGLPLTGEVLWPGTVVENGVVVDWPGWTRNADGSYTEGDEYDWTRDGVQLLFQVNPSATTTVAYPPATAICSGPVLSEVLAVDPTEEDGSSAVLAADPDDPTGFTSAVLAATGLSTGPFLAIGAGLLGAGALLVLLVARRRRSARHTA